MSFDTKFNRTAKTLADGHARFIAKCPQKGCHEIKAADVPLKQEVRRRYLPMAFPPEQRAAYDGRYTVSVPNKGALPWAKCPTHGHAMAWRQVEGTVSDARKCDPRCTSAIGPVCVCACGGANHSANYL